MRVARTIFGTAPSTTAIELIEKIFSARAIHFEESRDFFY
jgi:hypothetical protein